MKEVKSNPHKVKKVFIVDNKKIFGLKKLQTIDYIRNTELPILDRIKTGTSISKDEIMDIFKTESLLKKDDLTEETKDIDKDENDVKPVQISLLEIDDKLKQIDEFLGK